MNTLRRTLNEYLRLRRALGFQLRDVERQLGKFVSFLGRRRLTRITNEATLSWLAKLSISATTKARRCDMVRNFAQYLHAADPRHEVPPRRLLPCPRHRLQPYIYSEAEIARLLHAAQRISSAGFRAQTYSTLLGLLVVTGMRVGECLALNDGDVDLEEGILSIVGTKFRKSRLIPLHLSTQKKLRHYAQWRDRVFPEPKSPSFLVSNRGTRLLKGNVRDTFVGLACQVGLRRPSDRHGPRLHDFRHRFAVKTLQEWYQAGVDVEQHLPELATYLGHTRVASTYWYLTGTQDLLQLVAARLDRAKEGQPV